MSVLDLSVSSGPSLDVRRFSVRETLSEPFEIMVVAQSEDFSLDLDFIVGGEASFRISKGHEARDADTLERRWTGICRFAEMEQSEPSGSSTYRFVLVPALWQLGQRRRHRIFQHRSAPEIAADLLDEWGVVGAFDLDRDAHPRRPLKVQYDETDLAFFCRVLEEAGISFAFPNGKLTLSDRLHAGVARPEPIPYVPSPVEGAGGEMLTHVHISNETRPGAATFRDHDLRRPDYSYRANVLDLSPGRVFTVVGHPHPELGAHRLLVLTATIDGAPGEVWTVGGRAVSAEHPYRPRQKTPRPRARVQSAIVIGPSGEDVHTDEFGRVCVRFPWERSDGGVESACPIRVSQGWAGAGHGMITLPRVGQEVLVDFLGGDPEQPVIVGRLFNAQNPVVERLPAHATKSVWKSKSTTQEGAFNAISFDDEKGQELFSEQAERDARRLVKHDETSTISRNRDKRVANHERCTTGQDRAQNTCENRVDLTSSNRTAATVGTRRDVVRTDAVQRTEGERRTRVGRDLHVITGGERRTRVEHEAHLQIGKDRRASVGGKDSLTVGERFEASVGSYAVDASGPEGTIHWVAGSAIVIESGAAVTIKAGPNFVEIGGGKVVIVGSEVVINEGGAPGELPHAAPKSPELPRIALVDEPSTGALNPA